MEPRLGGKGCDICLTPAHLEERNRRITDEESFDDGSKLEDLFLIFRFLVQGPLTLGEECINKCQSS